MLSRDQFSEEMYKVIAWLQQYFDTLEQYPVKSQVLPREIFGKFEDQIPLHGASTEEILLEITERILPGITHWQHPNFHAYFPANSSVESVMAETITAGIGAQCMMWVTSPAAAELEEKVLGWLRDNMKIPRDWYGVIQDTASTASLTAILTAREKATNFSSNRTGVPSGLTAYCSTQTHSSIEKAIAIAGIGTDNLRKIGVNSDFSMNVTELKKVIEEDINAGFKPFCVVSALGTTGTVAMDDIDGIGDICTDLNIWHHVDAAYAGTALLLEEYQLYAKGLEKADSFVFNPHKWMFTNFDCSVYFLKNNEYLIRTFEAAPEYLRTTISSNINNYKDWGVPLGRRFRALKLWWVIKSYGLEGIQNILRHHIELAQYFCDKIKNHSDIEFLTSPILNFCCIRWHPTETADENILNQKNADLLERLNKAGQIYISHTMVDGKYGLRFVFGQTYLAKMHIDKTYNALISAINESDSGAH